MVVDESFIDIFFSSDLTSCTQNDNVSIPNLADLIFERCTNSSWVVVFKAECTFHHLMSYGNEVSYGSCISLRISLVKISLSDNRMRHLYSVRHMQTLRKFVHTS